ncbi:MAG: integrase arm-type DNA-binding domain-containing protein [Gluconobacter sp.]
MSKLPPNQLTVRKVASLKDGVYGDGGNLWITVRGDTRAWTFRYKSPVTGKRREMGLGPARDISLAEARLRATENRRLLLEGIDPLEEKARQKGETVQERTFAQVAEQYITEQAPGWKDPRSAPMWRSSLDRHVYPVLGQKPIGSVQTEDVLAVLRPIWENTTETATRLRGRMERILDYAQSHHWREGENPARWRGHLANILPKPTAVSKVVHHAALPYRDLPPVYSRLSAEHGVGALAARFICLTATRSGEVRKALWSEIDLKKQIWTIPAERMKAGREHRVPLTNGAMALLYKVQTLRSSLGEDSFVFPGGRVGSPLSDVAVSKALHQAAGTKDVTIHGLRSSFRDWAAEETDFPREVAEMALAHAIGDKVEAAYRRGDLFNRRAEMMFAWERFCAGQSSEAVAKPQRPNPDSAPLFTWKDSEIGDPDA